MLLKKYREQKLMKYKNKLISKKFNSNDIANLIKIYKICTWLTSIIWICIIIIATSITMIVLTKFIKNDFFEEYKKTIIWVSSILLGMFTILYHLFTIYLFIKVIFNSSRIVKKKAKIWAFLSLIPGIGFIFFFIMKRIICWIYCFKK